MKIKQNINNLSLYTEIGVISKRQFDRSLLIWNSV